MDILDPCFNLWTINNMTSNLNDNLEHQAATPEEQAKPLTPEAMRALKEAQERREAGPKPSLPKEMGGRGGEEPVRYGDWEIKGLASDF
jgi:hypothetical protein